MFKAVCDGQEKYLYSDEELNDLIKQQQKVKVKSESDWKKYYGSCPELKQDIGENGKENS